MTIDTTAAATTATPTPPATPGARLKAETAEHHKRAETHAFQKSLASGRLTKDDYVAYLGQMLHVHRALESRLREARDASAGVREVVTDEQFQVPYLEADLRHFGVDPASIQPGPAARAFEAELATLDPEADAMTILAMHYVLEGSNNGNRFIARPIAAALGLTGPGLKYLTPYGERQPELWKAFKTALDRQPLTQRQIDAMVEAAGAMFDWVHRVSDDLAASRG